MNERFKALREQSIKWAYENQQSMDGAMDKFGELIVQDCLTIIRMNDNETPWFSEADGRARTILREVKEHFGVK